MLKPPLPTPPLGRSSPRSAFGGAFDISPTSHLDASSAPLRIPLPRGVWADVSASNLCRLVQVIQTK